MDEKYMHYAITLAKKAKQKGDLPFGAIIVKDNQIIGEGYSQEKVKHDVTKHAEIIALQKACSRMQSVSFENCSLYSTHEPCVMCAAALFQTRITNMYIGTERQDLKDIFRKKHVGIESLLQDQIYKPIIRKHVCIEETLKLWG